MTPLSLTVTPFSSSTRSYLKPTLFPPLTPFRPSLSTLKPPSPRTKQRMRYGSCRAEFSHDAPFAAAIGACMLNSLVFPVTGKGPDNDSDSVFDLSDTRFSIMGIISFIPYFN